MNGTSRTTDKATSSWIYPRTGVISNVASSFPVQGGGAFTQHGRREVSSASGSFVAVPEGHLSPAHSETAYSLSSSLAPTEEGSGQLLYSEASGSFAVPGESYFPSVNNGAAPVFPALVQRHLSPVHSGTAYSSSRYPASTEGGSDQLLHSEASGSFVVSGENHFQSAEIGGAHASRRLPALGEAGVHPDWYV